MSPKDRSTHRLLMRSDQMELMDRSLEQQAVERTGQDEAAERRRAEYLERLRDALPELRKLEGFPIGTDDDILALSDPPYYTACPNPFLGEFIAEHGTPYDEATDDYHREPFAADVSEGRNDPIYKAHSYHTKVPHKAIARYIDHYVPKGGITLDGFCGSGMTGMGVRFSADPTRSVVLQDLSPAATTIARSYLSTVNSADFAMATQSVLQSVRKEVGWMYRVRHDANTTGEIEYVVWSQVFSCAECGSEIEFYSAALNSDGKIRESFECPTCGASQTKDTLLRVMQSELDPADSAVHTFITTRPVRISYFVGKHRIERPIHQDDVALLRRISELPYPIEVPTVVFPISQMYHGSRLAPKGVTRVHHLYFTRAAHVLSSLWRHAAIYPDVRLRPALQFWVEQAAVGMTILNRHHVVGRANVNQQLNGVYYIPSVQEETSAFRILEGKADRLSDMWSVLQERSIPAIVSTGTCSSIGVSRDSIDYVFTDPPFGENIYYADLNFVVESWLKVRTELQSEAIVDRAKAKKLPDYQRLMEECFREYHRVLKPGRWMTVVFHNSSNAVWNAIQEAIHRAGFVVADVRIMDKQQGSYRQLTSTAVKQDLVISAYKPRSGFERTFSIEAGSEQGAWDFVRQHLEQLPVFVERAGRVEVIAERQNYLLYDRMIAFHIQRGATIPLSAGDFYRGLRERFVERDDMYFTVSQAADYDRRRMEAREIEQLSVFVVDEKSAIQWVRAELAAQPQTFQDLTPKFLRELNQNRFEEMPELRDILAQNFLEDPDTHRWRVPDPAKQADLEALRTRELLTEFGAYLGGTARLKRFRLEAVRAGIADLWSKRDYKAIIRLCERLPDEVVQEDPALLMYYDNAVMRQGGA